MGAEFKEHGDWSKIPKDWKKTLSAADVKRNEAKASSDSLKKEKKSAKKATKKVAIAAAVPKKSVGDDFGGISSDSSDSDSDLEESESDIEVTKPAKKKAITKAKASNAKLSSQSTSNTSRMTTRSKAKLDPSNKLIKMDLTKRRATRTTLATKMSNLKGRTTGSTSSAGKGKAGKPKVSKKDMAQLMASQPQYDSSSDGEDDSSMEAEERKNGALSQNVPLQRKKNQNHNTKKAPPMDEDEDSDSSSSSDEIGV